MANLRMYLFSVIAAAFICAVIRSLVSSKAAYGAIINVVASVFMVITVLTPRLQFSFSDLTDYLDDCSNTADYYVDEGVSSAQAETVAIIKEQVETYIEDKAKSLGVQLEADVSVSDSTPAQLESVVIISDVSPYMQRKISHEIATELGIPEADQQWK